MYLIFREGRSERRRRLYEHGDPRLHARARDADEACDIAYHDGDRMSNPILCEGGPEAEQAFNDLHQRRGFDPDELHRQWSEQDG